MQCQLAQGSRIIQASIEARSESQLFASNQTVPPASDKSIRKMSPRQLYSVRLVGQHDVNSEPWTSRWPL